MKRGRSAACQSIRVSPRWNNAGFDPEQIGGRDGGLCEPRSFSRSVPPPHILLGSLFHGAHSFVEEETTLADFTRIRKGAELLARRGDGARRSTVSGGLAGGRAGRSCPRSTTAPCHGQSTPCGVPALPRGIRRRAEGGPRRWRPRRDPGLRCTARWSRPVRSLRRLARPYPRGARLRDLADYTVFDLRTNFTASMAQHANALVAYKRRTRIRTRADPPSAPQDYWRARSGPASCRASSPATRP